MPQRFKVYEQNKPHFITSTVVHWIPIFCRDDYFTILTDSLTYCCINKGLLIHAYCLMPNHFHLTCSQQEGKLSSVIGDMKEYTSKLIASKLQEDGRMIWLAAMRRASDTARGVKVWEDGFHPEQIHSQEFLLQKLNYVHYNPVRAGYVREPEDWKYSSAGFYIREEESVVPVTPLV